MPSSAAASAPASSSGTASPLRSVFGALEKKYPQYRQQFDQAHKAATHASSALDVVAPYFEQLSTYTASAKKQAEKHHLEDFAPMFIGLALCFFGGAYTMLIAVVETVRMLCWEDLKKSFDVMRRNFVIAQEQNRRDNLVDEDHNGIADVQEMDRAQLFSRKAALFMKSVDIEAVQTASRTLASAFLSVTASLRVKLARSLALGASLANMAKEYTHLDKTLYDMLPPDQKRWAATISNVLITIVTMTVSTLLSGIIGTLHCCIRGSDMFVRHAVHIARERGLLEDDISMDGTKARALMAVVAAMGFLWQIAHPDAHPFPINILLLPFTIAEFVLSILVSGALFTAP